MTLRRALVRPPGPGFASGLTTAGLGAPDLGLAREQHARYCDALEACGLGLLRLPPDPDHPDATFVEDTAIVLDDGAILTRPGAPSREGEVGAIREALAPIFGAMSRIEAPGTLDGGDVCRIEDRFLVGISARTNEEGARQLSLLLSARGYSCDTVDVPATGGLLHLKSGIASLGGGRVAAVPALEGHPALARWEVVSVPAEEGYAANCVRLNDRLLVAAGFPRFERRLGELGYRTLAVPVTEFQKMDGGLSCLSLRW